MNKAELVRRLGEKTGLTKKDARAALDGVVELVTASLKRGEPVIITGFGKFETRRRKATTRMNPQTGQKIKTPAKVVPAFKAGKNLKDTVAGGGMTWFTREPKEEYRRFLLILILPLLREVILNASGKARSRSFPYCLI